MQPRSLFVPASILLGLFLVAGFVLSSNYAVMFRLTRSEAARRFGGSGDVNTVDEVCVTPLSYCFGNTNFYGACNTITDSELCLSKHQELASNRTGCAKTAESAGMKCTMGNFTVCWQRFECEWDPDFGCLRAEEASSEQEGPTKCKSGPGP